jgi:hypothetical protein
MRRSSLFAIPDIVVRGRYCQLSRCVRAVKRYVPSGAVGTITSLLPRPIAYSFHHLNRTHSAGSYQSASRYLSLCQIMTSLSQFQHAAICSIPLLKASRCESSDLRPSAHTSQVMLRQGVSDPRDKRTITMPDGGVKRDRSVKETLLECRRGRCGQFVLTSGGYPKRPWKSAKGGCQ